MRWLLVLISLEFSINSCVPQKTHQPVLIKAPLAKTRKGKEPPHKAQQRSTLAWSLMEDRVHQLTKDSVHQLNRDGWYGVYVYRYKAGYGRIWWRRSLKDEPGSYAFFIELWMGGKYGAGAVEQYRQGVRYYAKEPPCPLIEIREREKVAGKDARRIYIVDEKGLVLKQKVNHQSRPPQLLAKTNEKVSASLLHFSLRPGKLRVGQKISYVEFDTEKGHDQQHLAKVTELRKMRVWGIASKIAQLELATENSPYKLAMTVGKNGVVYQAELGKGILIRREPEQLAKSKMRSIDPLFYVIPIKSPLGDMRKIRKLSLELGLSSPVTLWQQSNQIVTKTDQGKFRVVIRSKPGPRITDEEKKKYLASTLTINADHPTVIQLAKQLTKNRQEQQKVARLVDWIYRHIRPELHKNWQLASQVLANRSGDCTDVVKLFVALARAAGIPARRVMGLIYQGDEYQHFGWHEWAEVAVNNRWLQVDPQHNEVIANATHIKLGESSHLHSAFIYGVKISIKIDHSSLWLHKP